MKKPSVLPLIAAMGLSFGIGMAALAVVEPECVNRLFDGTDARGICTKLRNAAKS